MTNMVAVVTGGTGGLGKEIVTAFYENAYSVVINYLESKKIAKQFSGIMGDKAMPIRANVSRYKDVERMADQVYRQWGKVDVLVNNAGITKDSLMIRQSEDEWCNIINTNLKGAFNTIRAFAPLMRSGGHIVNMSSYSGLKGKAGQSAYSASKAALSGLTKTTAIELAEYGIRVNAILPGYMPTKMGISADGALKRAKDESLFNTLSDTKEVARFIMYLVGTKNITGQTFCLESRIM